MDFTIKQNYKLSLRGKLITSMEDQRWLMEETFELGSKLSVGIKMMKIRGRGMFLD